MSLTLSICIPVHNFGAFLGQTLDSILPQTDDGVEVVVFDGGSTDGTPELMGRLLQSWPNLRYHRADAKGGIDADLASCVALARGEYCWLFSGDDLMRPGALARLGEMLGGGHDVILCKHSNCTFEMELVNEHPVFTSDRMIVGDLAKASERLAYFLLARTTEAFFSFMSSVIVRKAKWCEVEEVLAFRGSCWGHVARLFELSKRGLKVCGVPEVWLDKRGENDAFMGRGVVHRCRIGIEGYHRLADTYFGHDSEEAGCIRRALSREYDVLYFVGAKAQAKANPTIEDRELLDALVAQCYCVPGLRDWGRRLAYRLIPSGLYPLARSLYKRFRRVERLPYLGTQEGNDGPSPA